MLVLRVVPKVGNKAQQRKPQLEASRPIGALGSRGDIPPMEGFRKKRRWALSEGWRDNLMKASMGGLDKSKSYYENWEREEK